MIKKLLKKILFGDKADEQTWIASMRKQGAHIGERVRIFEPRSTCIDMTRPYMIHIGDDVQITRGVTILTHGYDWSVLKGAYGKVLGSCGEVFIGNNCFIGMNATILKGVHIGNNCIIGAGSLVNRDIPDGTVAAGNPAKPITTVEAYFGKRQAAQWDEAKELYRCYVSAFGKEPPEDEFSEFFYLFAPRDKALSEKQKKQIQLLGNEDDSLRIFSETPPMFPDYGAFIKALQEETAPLRSNTNKP